MPNRTGPPTLVGHRFAALDVDQQLVASLRILLSTFVISGINIAVSGHLLSYIFDFEGRGSDHFTMHVPPVFRLKSRGRQVVAGFAAFAISLLLVGALLPDVAVKVVITNLQATSSQWVACQFMATLVSVAGCIALGAVRQSWLFISASIAKRRQAPIPSPEARAQELIRGEMGQGE